MTLKYWRYTWLGNVTSETVRSSRRFYFLVLFNWWTYRYVRSKWSWTTAPDSGTHLGTDIDDAKELEMSYRLGLIDDVGAADKALLLDPWFFSRLLLLQCHRVPCTVFQNCLHRDEVSWQYSNLIPTTCWAFLYREPCEPKNKLKNNVSRNVNH